MGPIAIMTDSLNDYGEKSKRKIKELRIEQSLVSCSITKYVIIVSATKWSVNAFSRLPGSQVRANGCCSCRRRVYFPAKSSGRLSDGRETPCLSGEYLFSRNAGMISRGVGISSVEREFLIFPHLFRGILFVASSFRHSLVIEGFKSEVAYRRGSQRARPASREGVVTNGIIFPFA